MELEETAPLHLAGDCHAAMHQLGQPVRDVEPDARTAEIPAGTTTPTRHSPALPCDLIQRWSVSGPALPQLFGKNRIAAKAAERLFSFRRRDRSTRVRIGTQWRQQRLAAASKHQRWQQEGCAGAAGAGRAFRGQPGRGRAAPLQQRRPCQHGGHDRGACRRGAYLLVLLSAWQKGRKRRSRASAGMPMPVSCTTARSTRSIAGGRFEDRK